MTAAANIGKTQDPVAISVVLCTYNRAGRLSLVLGDLERQRLEPGTMWEVIVVDNNSNDPTRDVVEETIKRGKLPCRYLFEAAQGLSFARNAALRAARGDLIAFTDDDVRLPEDWVDVTVRTFREHDCIAVGGRVIPQWSVPQPAWLVLDGPFKTVGVVTRHEKGEQTRCYDETMYTPIGANMAFRREAFSKYGEFRTDIGRKGEVLLSGEDREFFKRLQSGGETLVYQARSRVFHPVDPARLSRGHFRKWYFYKGRSRSNMRREGESSRKHLAVPLGVVRNLFLNLLRYVLSALRMNGSEAFYYQLQVFYVAGQIDGYFRRRDE
jgi:glycosyltransferase involved in cell wall biosynthesis